jgi:hypothetical protein
MEGYFAIQGVYDKIILIVNIKSPNCIHIR